MKRTITIAALGVVLALAGCSTHTDAPDPIGENIRPGTNQHVIQEPDGFRNVAFSCFGGNGVYVTSAGVGDNHPSSVYVVANDINCTKG